MVYQSVVAMPRQQTHLNRLAMNEIRTYLQYTVAMTQRRSPGGETEPDSIRGLNYANSRDKAGNTAADGRGSQSSDKSIC